MMKCPSCSGICTINLETGICIECGFNIFGFKKGGLYYDWHF